MQLRMDKKDAIPIREWEEFLAIARRAGASDDTMIEDEVHESDPDIQIGFKIDVEHAGEGRPLALATSRFRPRSCTASSSERDT
jgi:hypothetical protein